MFVWNEQDHPVPHDTLGVDEHVLKKANGTNIIEFDLLHLVVSNKKYETRLIVVGAWRCSFKFDATFVDPWN